jgi:hypothetical protein
MSGAFHAGASNGGTTMKTYASGLLAATLAVFAAPASAGVFYQSIPDLTIAPNIAGYCSTCSGSQEQSIGQTFVLGSNKTVRDVTFTVSPQYFPAHVTLGFFNVDIGTKTVGSNVQQYTFSTFASVIPLATGPDLVTVKVGGGGLALSAGSYVLFITNPINLTIPAYQNNPDGVSVAGTLQQGSTYSFIGNHYELAVAFSDAVPEAPTSAMMAIGFAGLGLAGCRRTRPLGAILA